MQEQREVKIKVIESFDNLAGLRNGLKAISEIKDYYCGIPMPLENEQLVVEPTYPHAKELMSKKSEENTEYKIRNSFYSTSKRCKIYVIEKKKIIK